MEEGATTEPGASRPADRHWHRIARGVGANLLGKFWVILSQVISVPVLLSLWGPKGYGVWLMLMTAPTYVALSDFGFGSAAAISMTQMIARGEKPQALGVFQSVWLLVTLILAPIVLTSAVVWANLSPLCRLVGLTPPPADVAWAFLILMVYSAVAVEMGVVLVGFRSTRRYARGTMLYDLTLPAETLALLSVAVLTRSVVDCAAAILAVRIPAFCLYYTLFRRDEPWLRFGWSHASWSMIRVLTKPALANFAMPLGLAMSVQGVIFTIGLTFGPAAAGVFGAVRTLTRFPLQMVSVLTRASQPELTIAHSLANVRLIVRITALNLATAILCLAPFMLVSPWGGMIMPLISRGRVHVTSEFFIALQAVACVQAIWSTFAMFLFAENKLQKVVPWCLAAGALEMATPFVAHAHLSMTGLAVALGAFELMVLCAAARLWWRESGLALSDVMARTEDLRVALSTLWAAMTARRSAGP